jgi:hypothetical protein
MNQNHVDYFARQGADYLHARPAYPAALFKEYYDTKYANVHFPFDKITAPDFFIELNWLLQDVLNVLNSYSGSQEYLIQHGVLPTVLVENELRKAWGDNEMRRTVKIPLLMKAGRVKVFT